MPGRRLAELEASLATVKAIAAWGHKGNAQVTRGLYVPTYIATFDGLEMLWSSEMTLEFIKYTIIISRTLVSLVISEKSKLMFRVP